MSPVIHVTTADEWDRARGRGTYGTERIERQGFLHLCTPEQLGGVIDRYFGGTATGSLVGLVADADQLGDALRWESTPPSEERFPHLYRPLQVSEVQSVHVLPELLALRGLIFKVR